MYAPGRSRWAFTVTTDGVIRVDGAPDAVDINAAQMSVVFTCEFNFDLACGIIDPQWGVGSSFVAAPVPLPAGGALLLTGIAGLMVARRRLA